MARAPRGYFLTSNPQADAPSPPSSRFLTPPAATPSPSITWFEAAFTTVGTHVGTPTSVFTEWKVWLGPNPDDWVGIAGDETGMDPLDPATMGLTTADTRKVRSEVTVYYDDESYQETMYSNEITIVPS